LAWQLGWGLGASNWRGARTDPPPPLRGKGPIIFISNHVLNEKFEIRVNIIFCVKQPVFDSSPKQNQSLRSVLKDFG